ncbi:cysteine hydrolase family protein [Flavobacterium sp.]|uniref:cysteine hydrolase family protein n=1 Tax=Flavobacterium sp. TaxID=239 RepID=UPI0025BA979A|nr:cysteine hydrolase family protein [Flavobacterium sp.]
MENKTQKKEALLLIDIQNDYFEGGAYALVHPEKASKNAKAVLEKFRSDCKTIIHVQHIAEEGFFLPNTEGAKIHQDVLPIIGEKIITKHVPNSFQGTDLLSYLHENQITDLVICGMMTQICVDSAVRAAKDYGFTITLLADACATLDLDFQGKVIEAEQVQASFISALQFYYAAVTNTDQFLNL